MIVIALIGYGFYRAAKSREMNSILWTILGIVAYFLGQIIAGFIIGLVSPQMAYNKGALTIAALLSGIGSCLIVFAIMVSISGKKTPKVVLDESLIDDSSKSNVVSNSDELQDDI